MDEPLRLSKKAMARQERLATKVRKHQDRKARLVAEPASPQVPRIGSAQPFESRVPRLGADPEAYLNEAMTYCRERRDCEGSWSWGLQRSLLDIEWDEVIARNLNAHVGQTWRYITNMLTFTGTRRKPRKLNHYQEVLSLEPEAQDRWIHLELKDYPTAFRFRLGSRRRLWGYRSGTVFHVIWWDPDHALCKLEDRK